MPTLSDAALRCLLGLIGLSWRFDPKEDGWVHAGKDFTRREVQETCGLSDEGTRRGLSDLEDQSWIDVDRSERSYRYQLMLEVPTQRYTYLPSSLMGGTSEFASATALRVLLAIFRRTWGWAQLETDPHTGDSEATHRRWARLSTPELSERTGRSQTAVKGAIQDLGGEWIGRARPDQGAYLYRIVPGAFGPESEEAGQRDGNRQVPSSNSPVANDLPPDRQRSGPPTSFREKGERNKHSQAAETRPKTEPPGPPEAETNAVPGETPPGSGRKKSQQPGTAGQKKGKTPESDLNGLDREEKALAQKLVNAGVWPKRAKECLQRYSRERIAANFELFRRRKNAEGDPEIGDNGAWLCAAITDGYADLGGQSEGRNSAPEDASAAPAGPDHKQKVSAEEKKSYLCRCDDVEEQHFHRFRCAENPSEKQFLYLDPGKSGPARRLQPARGG